MIDFSQETKNKCKKAFSLKRKESSLAKCKQKELANYNTKERYSPMDPEMCFFLVTNLR